MNKAVNTKAKKEAEEKWKRYVAYGAIGVGLLGVGIGAYYYFWHDDNNNNGNNNGNNGSNGNNGNNNNNKDERKRKVSSPRKRNGIDGAHDHTNARFEDPLYNNENEKKYADHESLLHESHYDPSSNRNLDSSHSKKQANGGEHGDDHIQTMETVIEVSHEKPDDTDDKKTKKLAKTERIQSNGPSIHTEAYNQVALDEDLKDNEKDDEYTKQLKRYRRLGRGVQQLRQWRYRHGVLKVHVVRGIDLEKMDVDGESDPYVKIQVGQQKKRTDFKKNTKDPEWNEHFEFIVNDAIRECLVVKVRDKDNLKSDDPIGESFRVLITDIIIQNGQLLNHVFNLTGTTRKSKIVMSITYEEA